MLTRGSLTSTILGVMLVLILLSSSLAVYSIINLSFSIGDARAINASGSLRMQSYRLLLSANTENDQVNAKIEEFENTLNSNELQNSLAWYSPKILSKQYLLVIDKWQLMRSYAETGETKLYSEALTDFVDTVDTLVLEIERFSADKLRLLVLSQVIGLTLMLIVAAIAVVFTRRRVVKPLQLLMDSAITISQGNFDVDMPKTDYIELTALSNALKKTASELSNLYQDLEQQVSDKTLALTRANNELYFLYDNLIMLHSDRLDYKALKSALDQLQIFEKLDFLRLVIEHEDQSQDVIEASKGWPSTPQNSVCFPLQLEQTRQGYLEVISTHKLNNPLFINFAVMLARSITIHNATEQRQQLALMEERAVIARELHDSLGQLLSFLKIQVSLLRKKLPDSCRNEAVEQQISEINDGVSFAYAQLRELLSTFRLTIKEPNLNHALEVMLDQLRPQTDIQLSLQYTLSAHLLEAKQHIHILHLTREATLNAIKHANAKYIVIDCYLTSSAIINITISDDGMGVSHLKERDQHFGIGIMHERASKLNGQLSFSANTTGGTTVTLSFPPQQEPLNG
ncbi:nitrate/nitrite two-component system sensor histidine kinase NarQ [Shewanella glacialimarina]|uniref:nitrate/nitrite two-component system sensor histidine kinase NarQ n=1 Tax=Shewanella glacialimarina TaxID=2590884 RepID=UPI001CF8BC50|nr:nitrate/nitrite two-component system sensor histidine kinase NarQ [Shewanella glacialimarina]UCX05803.1 nitrate/nitrite two-component system sensor histidine kinase NarQ [Shewanella glacialimarina]